MSVLKRLSTLIKSNLNDVIDSMQDPGKEIDQLVRDMEDSARKAKQEVAVCLAEEKRLAKVVERVRGEAGDWEQKAMQAVKAGQEELAREALRRKGDKEAEIAQLEKALQEQQVQVDQLSDGLKALETRVKEVKLRQGTLREKARAARHGGGAVSTKTSAFADFDRMSSKIDELEVAAGLDDELRGRTSESISAERQLDKMSEESSLDDALAALKAKLDKKE